MTDDLTSVSGVIAKVRDHTVGVDSTVIVDGAAPYQSTRYFNEIEIDLEGSTTMLRVVSRWPDRLFLQNGDRVLAVGKHAYGKFQVDALCNLTDGSNYLLVGSPRKRNRLKRMSATLLPDGAAMHWFAA
jgi:hypothetical protein